LRAKGARRILKTRNKAVGGLGASRRRGCERSARNDGLIVRLIP